MSEFLHFLFIAPNILATFLLSFCVVYWLIVIVGVIDLDFIDIDLDIDADVDVDVDADVSGGAESGVAWLNKVLHFLNLGRVPFMLWLSIIALIAWIMVVIANYYLGIHSFFFGAALFIGALIVAMFIAKPLTFPLVQVFDKMEDSEGIKSVIGKMAEVVYPNKGNTPGEVEIHHNGSHIRIFVMPSSKNIELTRNQKVLVIGPSDNDPKVYLVEPYNNN
jgi:hypothetical protein